ncbi:MULTISPECIES: hypothetical protein [Prevotellaceae]|uniref:hypothetical protein n=1 Tax=Prevotellaceae TaxID=171552 RepID=UPI0003D2B656|nr:hypothetical protein [Prevotella phocaeensis]ETD18588.1 hypothetical protein HMPREF1199_01406 [Hoylesella oralis CC98A]
MKHSITVQRLCLFLFALLLTASAWATDYGCNGYEIFSSRYTVKEIGKKKPVDKLKRGYVQITFSNCKTTSGTGSGAIYELEKGSRITVKADDGFSIRWIILRDTEGGEDYDDKNGIKRISSVTSGYDYYFEKKSISNSGIKEGNKDDLNDDNNNIVVTQYDATAQSVEIHTHNNRKWGQFKVRDIIVGYVQKFPSHFEKQTYDEIINGGHYIRAYGLSKEILSCDDPNIAEFELIEGKHWLLHAKAIGSTKIRALFSADGANAKVTCEATLNVRDRLYTSLGRSILFTEGGEARSIYDIIKFGTSSKTPFDRNNPGFSIKSNNPDIVDISDQKTGNLVFSGKQGTASITVTQRKNAQYEGKSITYTLTVLRGNKTTNTMYIRNLDEWKLFAHFVNEKDMFYLNAKLDADINLGTDITMVGINGIKNYSGTFDGQGHTLSLDWNTTQNFCAPFNSVGNATIKNLHTKGQIANKVNFASGLISAAIGTITISNCVSEVNFKNTTNEESLSAGMVAFVKTDARVTINDCLVKGKVIRADNGKPEAMDGFVGPSEGGSKSTLNNCLYIDSSPQDYLGTVPFGELIVNNCYSLSAHHIKPRYTQVTAEQLKSGEVTYLLQNKRAENVWGQTLGTDNNSLPTAEAAKHVNKVDFTYKGRLKATRYANNGKTVSLPTAQDLLGAEYDAKKTYTLTYDGGFSASTRINADRTVAVNVTVVTGIDDVTVDAADVNSPVYNLRGQRVADRLDDATRSSLPAGIYIVGGRKMVVK